MFPLVGQTNIIVQGFIAVIIIGVFYNLYESTKAYGGLIGTAVRLLGIGMLFITIAVIEKAMLNLGAIPATQTLALFQDIMNLLGLLFLGLGFSKLASATKT
jgi:hypothetical protein